MQVVWISIVLGLFVALLFVNFYFRWKVIKVYQYLIDREIDFSAEQIFNTKKLRAEIIPRYPESEKQILMFVNYIHFSVKIASALIVLITLFGFIYRYYAKYES